MTTVSLGKEDKNQHLDWLNKYFFHEGKKQNITKAFVGKKTQNNNAWVD